MTYDVIVVGGGLAGSALADQLARAGMSILLLEHETRYRDRVRGENMLPWGVATARRLGILDTLLAAGGHATGTWQQYAMGKPLPSRDLRTTTPGGDLTLNMYHPALQEAALTRAIAAGSEVRRGTTVLGVDSAPGRRPTVTFEQGSERHTEEARVVVGADGRASRMRSWCEFEVRRSPDFLTIAGTLMEGTDVPDHASYICFGAGCASFWAPLGERRARAYYIYPGVAGRRGLSGEHRFPEFVNALPSAGVPTSWLDGVRSAGPLAEFDGADRWVPSPAKNRVALIGDAAASSDPSWGCGLSLTLLDVEHLAHALRSNADWDAALAQYAREHDEYYGALHRILTWMTELVWTPGPDADERRRRVFPRMREDPTGYPDSVGLGPFGPSDERARRLLLGLG